MFEMRPRHCYSRPESLFGAGKQMFSLQNTGLEIAT
jgi:hypothetical protein